MKRFQTLISCFLFFLLFNCGILAQEIAPFQLADPQAIEITEAVLEKLQSQTWHCHLRKFTMRTVHKNYENFQIDLTIQEGGLVYHKKQEGTWYIEEGNILAIEFDPALFVKPDVALAGGYAVYKITNDELILAKVLTSAYDNKMVYFFESEQKHQARLKAKAVAREQRRLEEYRNAEYGIHRGND